MLEPRFADGFAGIYGLRNILVHDYLEIDYCKLVKNLNTRLGDFERFAKEVAAFLQKEQ